MNPLIVDLDGTLILTDTLHESILLLLRESPFYIFWFPLWIFKGKAYFKDQVARRVNINAKLLPYNTELIDFLKAERANGRRILLCTAADRSISQSVAAHIGLFDDVLASDGVINLSGAKKAEALVSRFGKGHFDYAGNSFVDFSVWKCADTSYVVNASPSVHKNATKSFNVGHNFSREFIGIGVWRKVLRMHQWLKNLLLFLPIIAAHELGNVDAWQSLVLAFFAFNLCASAIYIVNDLLDLDSDRLHPRKRMRPFASGAVPIWKGVALAPVLLAASFTLAFQVGSAFFGWLIAYFYCDLLLFV